MLKAASLSLSGNDRTCSSGNGDDKVDPRSDPLEITVNDIADAAMTQFEAVAASHGLQVSVLGDVAGTSTCSRPT